MDYSFISVLEAAQNEMAKNFIRSIKQLDYELATKRLQHVTHLYLGLNAHMKYQY